MKTREATSIQRTVKCLLQLQQIQQFLASHMIVSNKLEMRALSLIQKFMKHSE